MTKRMFGLLLAAFVLTGVGLAQMKCDFKPEVEDADLPPCTPLQNGGRICPVLKNPNGMHPDLAWIWAHPKDTSNFEVTKIPVGLERRAHNACLYPRGGYEWVNPDDSMDFQVKPVSQSEAAPSSEAVPTAISPPPPPPSPPNPPAHVAPSNPRPPVVYGHGPEMRVVCSGQTLPSGWVIVGYQMCNDGRWGMKMLNPNTLAKGYILQVCAQSSIPDGWKEIGQTRDGECTQPNTASTGNNARKIQRQ